MQADRAVLTFTLRLVFGDHELSFGDGASADWVG